jgi:hypothetical protein
MKPARTGIRIGVGIQLVAAGILWVVANYLGFVHFLRIDHSRSGKFSLAGQTRSVLKECKKPLHITVVASPTFASHATRLLGDVRGLLTEYLFNKRKGLVVEYVDPTRNTARAQDLQLRFPGRPLDQVLIVEYDGRHRILELAELGDFDRTPVASGGEPVLIAFRGEQLITSAIVSLLKPDPEKIYFLQGHGEPSLMSTYSTWVESLLAQNTAVRGLSLASADAMPEDARAVVIASARSDLDEREMGILRKWLEAGGKMLVLLDPNSPTPRLLDLLRENGIQARDDRVLRLVKLPFAMGILRDVTGEVLPGADITRRLQGTNLVFPGATQSLALDMETAARRETRLRPLVQAAEEFWGETAYLPNQPGGVAYEDGLDNGQPLVIAATADRGALSDDRVDVQDSRLVVVGSSRFAENDALTKPGLDFLTGTVTALIDREGLTGITPKNPARFTLRLTDSQLSVLSLVSLGLIPGVAALAGLAVWIRRRA